MDDKTIVRTLEKAQVGSVLVSTVWLCLYVDGARNPSMHWETMVFGGPYDEMQERYATEADAVAGHARILAMVREAE